MTSDLDAGDILAQEKFALDGEQVRSLKITRIGTRLTKRIVGDFVRLSEMKAKPPFIRGLMRDNEITIREILKRRQSVHLQQD